MSHEADPGSSARVARTPHDGYRTRGEFPDQSLKSWQRGRHGLIGQCLRERPDGER